MPRTRARRSGPNPRIWFVVGLVSVAPLLAAIPSASAVIWCGPTCSGGSCGGGGGWCDSYFATNALWTPPSNGINTNGYASGSGCSSYAGCGAYGGPSDCFPGEWDWLSAVQSGPPIKYVIAYGEAPYNDVYCAAAGNGGDDVPLNYGSASSSMVIGAETQSWLWTNGTGDIAASFDPALNLPAGGPNDAGVFSLGECTGGGTAGDAGYAYLNWSGEIMDVTTSTLAAFADGSIWNVSANCHIDTSGWTAGNPLYSQKDFQSSAVGVAMTAGDSYKAYLTISCSVGASTVEDSSSVTSDCNVPWVPGSCSVSVPASCYWLELNGVFLTS